MQLSNFLPTWERKVLRVRGTIWRNPQNEHEDSKEGLFVVAMGEEGETLKQQNHQLLKGYHEGFWYLEYSYMEYGTPMLGLAGHLVHEYWLAASSWNQDPLTLLSHHIKSDHKFQYTHT